MVNAFAVMLMQPDLPDAKTIQDNLDWFVSAVVTVLAFLLPYLIRHYGLIASKGRADRLGRIVALADQAVAMAEERARKDDLPLGPDRTERLSKLATAVEFVKKELQKSGIEVDPEEAKNYVIAAYGSKVGSVLPVGAIAAATAAVADRLQSLDRRADVALPPGVDRATHLIGLAANALQVELAKSGISISADDAASWLRAEVFRRLEGDDAALPASDQLERLATEAYAFVDRLRAGGKLALQASGPAEETDLRIAAAWLLSEVSERGLPVSLDQVEGAILAARAAREGGSLRR
ncbi:hypothetical protein DCC79_00395 [bacterium]|nr:hypothetical protein [Chloroflexi bacterium CFX6]RIL12721.1 MAG: hypothetical protein DCC79_00395 [bacterium]